MSGLLLILLVLSACAPQISKEQICSPEPIVVPTLPVEIPREFELDKTTNLHRTGDPQTIDVETFTLSITGLVDNPLTFTYDDLRCMPKIIDSPSINCLYTFIDEAEWAGVPLTYVMQKAGIQKGATYLIFVSSDGYEARVELKDALIDENYLAYEWEGEPLPIMHGFPLRAVFPKLDGSYWVKWLVEIRVE